MSKNELYHHGVKGMKWGQWNEETRARYEGGKIRDEVNKRYKTYDKTSLNRHSEQFNEYGNRLAVEWDNYYKSLHSNKKFKEDVYSKMAENIGGKFDDEDDELFDLYAEEAIYDTTQELAPNELKQLEKDFYKAGDAYFNEAKAAVSDIVNKYKNEVIDPKSSYQGKQSAMDLAQKVFLDNDANSKWNSYMYRHYEDYWVIDVDSRYELQNDFSIQEYNNFIKNNSKGA